MGFIFQSFHLMGTLDAVENVALPLSFRGGEAGYTDQKGGADVGSGEVDEAQEAQTQSNVRRPAAARGEWARALVVEPDIIFADEPTGNLDSHTSKEVMELMRRVVREQRTTLVMVTHDSSLASYADRVFHIMDGRIIRIEEKTGKGKKR